MRLFRRCRVLLAFLAGWNSCAAAGLFAEDTVLEVTLEGPLTTVLKDTEERHERDFSLTVAGTAIDIGVRLRGKSRAVHCRFPPLRLDFPRKASNGTVFEGQDKLKLVTHCGSGEAFEQNVLEEAAAYRIMNILSEISFRIRLLRIRYVDTGKRDRPAFTRYGFLIESDEDLARRIGGEIMPVRDVTRSMLDGNHAGLVYLFQYLIGNTDWSLVRYYEDDFCCHNGKLFAAAEGNYVVPYDFDMSGLVKARYARPQPELRLRSVRIRRYRGYCLDRESHAAALSAVLRHREAILRVLAEIPGLTASNRRKQSRYLEDFFATASDKAGLLREMERRCL